MILSEPVTLETADGRALAATVFRPTPPHGVRRLLVVCPAMGVPRDYYFDFAEHAAERGDGVLTFDYRGIGGSAPPSLRGFGATLRDWGELDVPAAIAWTRGRFPDRPLALVAHSVGGQIAGLAFGAGASADGVLALGAQTGWSGHWRGGRRAQVLVLWYLSIPLLTRAFGFFPSQWFGLGSPLPAGVARQWAHWGRHRDYLRGRLSHQQTAGYRDFRGGVHLATASDDWLAPEAAVRHLASYYAAARTSVEVVRPADVGARAIGHFGYFRSRIGPPLWDPQLGRLAV